MARTVNPNWQRDIESQIFQSKPIDEIISFRPALQWLITKLSKLEIPYKLYNLGAGTTRITTDTDVCPCCKRRLDYEVKK